MLKYTIGTTILFILIGFFVGYSSSEVFSTSKGEPKITSKSDTNLTSNLSPISKDNNQVVPVEKIALVKTANDLKILMEEVGWTVDYKEEGKYVYLFALDQNNHPIFFGVRDDSIGTGDTRVQAALFNQSDSYAMLMAKRFLQLMDVSIGNEFEQTINNLPYNGLYAIWGERTFFIAPSKLKYGNGFALVEWDD